MRDIWQETDNIVKQRNIPIDIILELTRSCNLNCCHCYNVERNGGLDFAQVKEIASQLREAGCLFITLTGGEVFTRPDLLDIASYIRRCGFDIKIFTNGTLIDYGIAARLKQLCPSEVGISIHGAKASTHDKITGVAGSFRNSLAAIKMLKQMDIAVHMKCTLMKENFPEYKQIIRLADDLGVFYIIDPIVSPKDDGEKGVLAHRLNQEQIEEVFVEQFHNMQDDQDEQEGYFFCEAGRTFGSISANGDVYPCIQLPLKVGNVFQKQFKEIWSDSPVLNKMRLLDQADLQVCSDCRMAQYCSRCPGLAYIEDGDLFGPSNMACFLAGAYKRFQTLKKGKYAAAVK